MIISYWQQERQRLAGCLELRNRVYDLILRDEKGGRALHLFFSGASVRPLSYPQADRRNYRGLTQVNRLIGSEFSPQLYHSLYRPKVDFARLHQFLPGVSME